MPTSTNTPPSKRYRDGSYQELNPQWHAEDSPWKAEQIARMWRDSGLRFESVVEVGCGAGMILQHLSRTFPQTGFSGWDVSADAARFWPEAEGEIRFVRGDFLQDDHRRYDLVLLIDVFEHVEDYMGFLRRLRPRGAYFMFHIPLEMNVQGILRDIQIGTRRLVGHLHYFSRKTALATLSDCGYEIVDWRYTDAALARPKKLRTRLLNLLRRPAFKTAPDLTVKLLGGWSLLVLAKGRGSGAESAG